jgi:hypothetical protein
VPGLAAPTAGRPEAATSSAGSPNRVWVAAVVPVRGTQQKRPKNQSTSNPRAGACRNVSTAQHDSAPPSAAVCACFGFTGKRPKRESSFPVAGEPIPSPAQRRPQAQENVERHMPRPAWAWGWNWPTFSESFGRDDSHEGAKRYRKMLKRKGTVPRDRIAGSPQSNVPPTPTKTAFRRIAALYNKLKCRCKDIFSLQNKVRRKSRSKKRERMERNRCLTCVDMLRAFTSCLALQSRKDARRFAGRLAHLR